ncbi:hypothetical protein GCM10011515_09210 [Tsuneonella deserti]|uniref:Uncharacterized protein n=1 Tax=Tsuneonella deserti TaxID=2035528 RepID=A0ABQ1S5H5_9SPHN|nr:hypothetical protein [Tsuneonella deserti]GGD91697.1 hypothetical protein GCM10011515_09210 [Tsuneonella deserti]
MRMGLVLGALACLLGGSAAASEAIDVNRSVYVERRDDGVRALEPATTLKSGDKVVLVVEWRTAMPGRPLTVEAAVPRTLAFQRAGSEAVQVSIDNGRTWGRLGALRLGQRIASAEDVTHLRLRVPASAPEGRMTYSAIVR